MNNDGLRIVQSREAMKRLLILGSLGVALLVTLALVFSELLHRHAEKVAPASQGPLLQPQPQPPPAPPTIEPPRPTAKASPPPSPTESPRLPPNTTVARPGGPTDPDAPIRAAPLGQRVVRDHRETHEPRPAIKVTPQGMTAARTAIGAAVASCLAGPETLQFVLQMRGGRAQAQSPRLVSADRQPEAQACVEKALAELAWNTPDPDGSTPVTMPIFGATSSAAPKR